MYMQFDDDFDKTKSDLTKKDRGINFMEARELWDDPQCIDGAPGNVTGGESRWLIVGKALDKLWTACYTHRHSKIRIISVRPARQEEKDIYES